MMYISAGVFCTNRAFAIFIERGEVVLVFVIWNLIFAVHGVYAAIAAVAGREYAVKRVDACLHADKHILRFADAEQVPRLFFWKLCIDLIQNTEDVLLAERTADAIAVEVHICQISGALDPQVGKSPALHDAIYSLLRIFFDIVPVSFEAPVGPSMRPVHSLFLILIIGRGAGALVERKNNIRAKAVLDFYRTLRRKAMQAAIHM